MVAYSFAPMFEVQVARFEKLQTVRGHRKRHARPGEAIQLYMGMRTRQCRKLVTTDPICIDVRNIYIGIGPRNPNIITDIEIEGVPLDARDIELFALADGFGSPEGRHSSISTARQRMGRFWLDNHPGKLGFAGVVIRWEPR